MPTIKLRLPKPHAGQQQILREKKRFNVICCGRRFGKTLLCINLLVEPALAGFPAAWFAPSYKYLIEVWRDTVRILAPVIKEKNASEKRIQLLTGGVIDFWSLEDPDAGRSRKYKRAVVDEAAKCRHLKTAWTESIRATLSDYEGDAFFPSTPKGLNYFHDLYQFGQDDFNREWKSWQMPTSTNPFIKPAEIEAARLGLPEKVFSQEYLADFLSDGAFFRFIDQNATAVAQSEKASGHSYVIGVDWAKSVDFSVFTVIDEKTKELVYLDRHNGIDYIVQRNRLKALCEKFKPTLIIAESNSIGEPNIEMLRRDGLRVKSFTTTNATKANAIEDLALAFERGELKILKNDILIGELKSFEAEYLPSGLVRYSAPDGQHDDTVMSLAMAWTAVKGKMRGGAVGF
jgi:hypothetical protein